mmetsp:Transcript_3486/g.8694  ORF Transcript_3486/g.8694 Transcript_3486/m.8694 type:complete len:304 (+) Transcript_3486:4002-4913(+)
MAHVEDVERPVHVHDGVARLRLAALIDELHQPARAHQRLFGRPVRVERPVDVVGAGGGAGGRLQGRGLLLHVLSCHQQPAHQPCGRYAFGPLEDLEPSGRPRLGVAVGAVRTGGEVVPMRHVVAAGLLEEGHVDGIGRADHDVVHPLAARDELAPLLLGVDGPDALGLQSLLVRHHAHHQSVTHRPRLADGVEVARVHEVEDAVRVDADGLARRRDGRIRLRAAATRHVQRIHGVLQGLQIRIHHHTRALIDHLLQVRPLPDGIQLGGEGVVFPHSVDEGDEAVHVDGRGCRFLHPEKRPVLA